MLHNQFLSYSSNFYRPHVRIQIKIQSINSLVSLDNFILVAVSFVDSSRVSGASRPDFSDKLRTYKIIAQLLSKVLFINNKNNKIR